MVHTAAIQILVFEEEIAEAGGPGNLADQVVNSALKYRVQAPLVESLMSELGLDGKDLNGLTAALSVGNTPKEVNAE